MQLPIVILGGRGMLGTEVASRLAADGVPARALDLPECDATRPGDLARALDGAGAVINCAAFTAVDEAEAEPARVRAINALAVGTLGELARARGLYVAHISTDFVFDGAGDQPWRETDAPRPLSVYGRTKLEGERLLQESGCAHVLVRVQWSYGRAGAHFIGKLIERAREGGPITVVHDQIGAPTWTRDTARAVVCLVRARREGLFHFANGGYASRYEVARFVTARLGLSNPLIPCSSEEFPTPAARPKNSRFDTARIQAALDFPVRPWPEALAEFLDSP